MRLSILQRTSRLLAILTLSLLVLSSCSTDEGLTTKADNSGQLTFNVCADGYGTPTRGTPMNSVSGAAGLIGFEFTDDWDEDDDKYYLMYNDVLQGSGEIWKTSKAYFPDPDKKKRFYAYYPFQAGIDNPSCMLYFNDGDKDEYVQIPTFVYTSPAKAADQKDLMFAVSEDVEYEEVDGEMVLKPIEMTFHHLLSALKITVKNGFDNGVIKSVSISKIKKKGEFYYDSEEWAVMQEANLTITQDVEVNVSTKKSDVLPLTSDTEYFMLLPQELNQASILTLVFNNGKQDFTIDYELGKKFITVPDGNGGTKQQHLIFKEGKITTLNITVESITKMTVKCTLTDWGSGAVFGGDDSDQNIIDFEYMLHDWEGYPGNDTTGSTEIDVITGPQS